MTHLLQDHYGVTPNVSQATFSTSLRTYNTPAGAGKKFWLIPLRENKDGTLSGIFIVDRSSPIFASDAAYICVDAEQDAFCAEVEGAAGEGEQVFGPADQFLVLTNVTTTKHSEGPQAYPEYKDKLADANYNNSRHMLCGRSRMSTVLWQTGLRNYSNKK